MMSLGVVGNTTVSEAVIVGSYPADSTILPDSIIGNTTVFGAVIAGSKPALVTKFRGVVQLIECGIWDAVVAGLSPVTPTDITLMFFMTLDF